MRDITLARDGRGSSWSMTALAASALVLFSMLLWPADGFAAGRVDWKSRTIKENDGAWKVEVTIYLSRAPDTALTPVRFSFTPTMYYERALIDGQEGPVLRKVPQQGRQPIIESVDVGFLDPGTGKLEKRTRFSFNVTRGRGFEAGEYKVEIKEGRSGAPIGTATNVVFDGENEIIDRRAIVFSGEKPKKDREATEESEAKPAPKELSPDDPAFWEGGPAEPEQKDQPLPPPASMREKPGGCGCRVLGRPSDSTPTAAVLAGLFLFGWVCRRARRTR